MVSSSSIAVGEQIATLPPEKVLAEYGWVFPRPHIEMATPGFSGALVWKITLPNGAYALKRWPDNAPFPIEAIERLTSAAHSAGLHFVPALRKTAHGQSNCTADGFHWNACTWQPGTAIATPDDTRLRQAVMAVAELHAAWKRDLPRSHGVCHAVALQYQRLSEWTKADLESVRIRSQSQTDYRTAYGFFSEHRLRAMKQLEPWLNRKVWQHWCVGDLWSDHLLFTDNAVTGIIDFGGIRIDHPAQDMARLIGSYTQGNAEQRALTISAYHPYSDELEALTILLDDVGTIVGLGNWLRWLVLNSRTFQDPTRVQGRLKQLVCRLFKSDSSHL